MATINKAWATIDYTGSGNGTAVFSAEPNTGEERTMQVSFVDSSRSVVVVRTLRQAGGGISETYTRLTYLESTGVQHLELDYILQDTDTIDVLFEPTVVKSADQFVFGAPNTWWSTYNQTGYARFGNSSSTSITSGTWRFHIQLSKGKVVLNEQTTTALTYNALTENGTINVFSGRNSNGLAYNRGNLRLIFFRVIGDDGIVKVNLAPAKRDSDGKVGALDIMSGKFYINADDGEDFIAGNEIRITEDYELIDRIAFNNDKAYDTQYQGNEQTYIDVLFQRTDTSGSDYLYGCSPSGKARITAYLSSSGAWRYGTSLSKSFNTANKNVLRANVSPTGIKINETSQSYTATAFTTDQNIPLGGHRSSATSSDITKTYQGYIYYFRLRQGDEQLVDWYPCKRLSDGVEGFWDCISQTFVEPA